MASVLLLPDPTVLALVDLDIDEAIKTITAIAVTTSLEAQCPLCGQLAHRVQSRYVRTLADLPCSGQRVRWLVQVRRFWCENAACIRKIFTERLPACALLMLGAPANRPRRCANLLLCSEERLVNGSHTCSAWQPAMIHFSDSCNAVNWR
jgi:transposase